jgi:hypothetical protein
MVERFFHNFRGHRMKNFRMVCVAAVLTLGVSVAASAADRAVSKAGLNKMGLGSMSVLSDKEGTTVRGKGSFAIVGGGTSSNLPGQHAGSVYAAGADHSHGSSVAAGASVSATGIATNHGYVVAGAVTGSVAYAK